MSEHIIGALPGALRTSAFRSPAWLQGGHMQTIWPYLLPRPNVAFRRERVSVPDGDFWDFDWVDSPRPEAGTPLVVLLHGLEGSSASHYARALMLAVEKRGWRGVIPHFRGCSGELNRLPRAYHSGDHVEAQAILDAIRARLAPGTPMYVVGVSVGGSVLINWLGRAGRDAAKLIKAAAAVSVPHDLMAAGVGKAPCHHAADAAETDDRQGGPLRGRCRCAHVSPRIRRAERAQHGRAPGLGRNVAESGDRMLLTSR